MNQEEIRALRETLGLSQQDLGVRLGLARHNDQPMGTGSITARQGGPEGARRTEVGSL